MRTSSWQSKEVQVTMALVQSTLDQVGSEVTAEQYILAIKRVAKTSMMAEQGGGDY